MKPEIHLTIRNTNTSAKSSVVFSFFPCIFVVTRKRVNVHSYKYVHIVCINIIKKERSFESSQGGIITLVFLILVQSHFTSKNNPAYAIHFCLLCIHHIFFSLIYVHFFFSICGLDYPVYMYIHTRAWMHDMKKRG